MKHLLDANVLLALCYEDHVHHSRVESWLSDLQARGSFLSLATCSITELAFVRIACIAGRFAGNVRTAIRDLKHMKHRRQIIFLDDTVDAGRLPLWVERPKQVTDGHLIAVAEEYNGTLVTLDEGIPGALLIPEQTPGPSAVREPTVWYHVESLRHQGGRVRAR